MTTNINKEDREKIEIFRSVFIGRIDAHGSGDGSCVKSELTDEVLLSHFCGEKRVGQYPLSPDIMNGAGTWWAVVDIDDSCLDAARGIVDELERLDIAAYIERSKSDGSYHVWVFFSELVPAASARQLMRYAVDAANANPDADMDLGSDSGKREVFPKQDNLDNCEYGNCLNLPLFGDDVKEGRTVFLDPENNYEPYSSQWEFLQSIKKVTPDQLAEYAPEQLVPDDERSLEDFKFEGGDLTRVLECDFIKHCRDNVADLPEPFWYAMISNLCRFDVGREKIHEFSIDYDGYSEAETEKKIQHALSGSNPIKCEKVKSDGFNCPRYGQCGVNAPAGLGYKKGIRGMIDRIPPDTDKIDLPRLLKPALREIAKLEPAEQGAYLNHHIKSRFGLTNKDVEAYRKTMKGLDVEVPEDSEPEEMSDEERREAMEFLGSAGLMEQTIADLTAIGIIGEDEAKGLVYLACTSRKISNPISLELRAPSGTGKSYMVEMTMRLMPPEDVEVKTRITARYLDYLKEDALVGKIFFVKERPGSEDADYSLRMLTDDTSSGLCIGYLKKNPLTGEFEPAEKTVRGPIVFIQTSMCSAR